MRKISKTLALLFVAMLLTSCTLFPAATTAGVSTPTPLPTTAPATTEPTTAPTEDATEAAAPAATPTPAAAPQLNLTPDLPDPAGWAASLKLDIKDYPRVDGSTATLPLAIYTRSKITGASLEDSANNTSFTMTGPSYIALASGAADVLIVYEAPDEVKQQLKGQSANLTMKPIGLDALVFLTNDGNPVKNLTEKQLRDIYTGKITKWNQVGGEKMDIVAYQRVSNSGSQALMDKLVMRGTAMMDAPSMLRPGEMDELVDAIASYENTKNALGYSVYYYVRNMYKVQGIKLLSVNGVAPGSETIASGQYPYINPFYAVIRADEPADSPAHKLFDWLTGSEGAHAVEDAGYVAAK